MSNINIGETDKSVFADQQFISISYNGKFNTIGGVTPPLLAYRVTFTANNKTYYIIDVGENQRISAPQVNPTSIVEGYTFKEWQLNGSAFNFDTVIENNIELVAKFEEASQHIIDADFEFTYDEGAYSCFITDPIPEGLTYNNYFSLAVNGTVVETFAFQPSGPMYGAQKIDEEAMKGFYLMLVPEGIEEGGTTLYGSLMLAGYVESTEPELTIHIAVDKGEELPALAKGSARFSDLTVLTWDELKLQENADKYEYRIEEANWTNLTVDSEFTPGSRYGIFAENSTLRDIYLDDTVTEIGNSAFSGSHIVSIIIPDSVTKINDRGVAGCDSLFNITIPETVVEIVDGAFNRDTFEAFDVSTNNPNYSSIDGILFNKQGTELLDYPGRKTGVYTIPNNVTVASGAFAYTMCEGIILSEGTTSITVREFDSAGLEFITIPVSVTSIGNSAFYDSQLTTINYNGTIEQWNAITKDPNWDSYTSNYVIHCTDGDIPKS